MDVSHNEMFIESLKLHPEIYDTRLKKYKDVKAKERAWEDLSATMDIPVEECMKRWRYLRDKYCREKKAAHIHELQNPNSKLSGASSRTWPFYDCMSFLDAHIKHRIFIKSYGHQQPFSTIDPSTMQQLTTNTQLQGGGGGGEESMLGNSDDQDSIGYSTFEDGPAAAAAASSSSSSVVVGIKEECVSPDNDDDVGEAVDDRGSQFAIEHKNHHFLRISNYSTLADELPASRGINPGVIVPHPTMDGDHDDEEDGRPSTSTSQRHIGLASPTSPQPQPLPPLSSSKKFRDDLQSELMEVIRATQVTINDIIRQKQASQQAEDEDDLFGRTIAASLKTFSPIKRLRAKASIFQLLLQLQQSDADQ